MIFPTNDYVERMIAADLLLPLEHAKLPNLANIERAFADPPFDPGLRHSAPYFWGTVGLGYRKSEASPAALADLFESDEYAGRIALLNTNDTILATLKYLGHSLNTKDPAALEQAVETLIKNKPKIRSFAPDTGQDLLIAGEVDVCLEFNGDILQVMEEDDDLGYVVPEEGSQLWLDNMCIPKGGPKNPGERAQLHQLHPRRRGPRRDRRPIRTPVPERRRARVHPRGGSQRSAPFRARGARAVRGPNLQG